MTNEEILENVTRNALARQKGGHFVLRREAGYLRVNAGGFRSVSVAPETPLCRLASKPASKIENAVAQLEDVTREARPINKLEEHPRPERSLQAHLILRALQNQLDLVPTLGGKLPFKRLLFALDEVPLVKGKSKYRCDLLAVGEMEGGVLEPVLIELKYKRLLGELLGQLETYADLVFAYRKEFERMLAAAVGREGVRAARVHRLLVWPEPERRGAPDTLAKLAHEGVIAVATQLPQGGAARSHRWKFRVEVAETKPLLWSNWDKRRGLAREA